jgi:hypothetical protein
VWGQSWGTLIWGGEQHAVPAMSSWTLALLSLALLALGYRMGKRRRAPLWLPWATGVVAALLPVAIVRASTFTVPVPFSNGTVADATQVNQDLNAIAAEVDSLRKQTASISECEFVPRDSAAERQCGLGQGGASIVDGSLGVLIAPLHVPAGATITSVDVYVNDTNASANLGVCTWGLNDTGSTYDQTVPCATSTGAPGVTKLTVTTNRVQGTAKNFELFVFAQDNVANLIGWPAGSTLSVRSAYAHYESP